MFEWARGHVFTGFPWNLFGYSWASTLPIAQLASLGGVYLLSLLTILWSALIGFLFVSDLSKNVRLLALLFVIVSFTFIYYFGNQKLTVENTGDDQRLQIHIVQPNIAQADKWNPKKQNENINKLLELTQPNSNLSNEPILIIWPETAITGAHINDVSLRTAIETTLDSYEVPVLFLTGLMHSQDDDKGQREYYNALILFDQRMNMLNSYKKSHLVPFGEYIPYKNLIPLKPIVEFSGFKQGDGPTTLELLRLSDSKIFKFSPTICYEIIFPGAVSDPLDRPNLIINATNDAWYGDSTGPRQHLVMAQFRAIEEGLPVVRSANTGISAIYDARGRIIEQTELNQEATITATLPSANSPTVYAIYDDKVYLTIILLLSGLAALITIIRKTKNNP